MIVRSPVDETPPLSRNASIVLALSTAHALMIALVDFQPGPAGLLLAVLVLEIFAVIFITSRGEPAASAAPAATGKDPRLRGQMTQLSETCQDARRTLISSLDENVSMGDMLGRGAKLLADFHERLREEEESIKVLLAGSQVARSAALNIQVVTSGLEARGLDLMAHDLEVLALNLEEKANIRRNRLEEGHKIFRSMAQQLRTERERARGGARMATRLDDLMARLEDTVRLLERSLGFGPGEDTTRTTAP